MRRLPLIEVLMVGVVMLAIVILLRSSEKAESLIDEENRAFAMIGRLDGSEPLPPELSPVPDSVVRRFGGYLYVAYADTAEGPLPVELGAVAASRGPAPAPSPHMVLAWPERFGETGRRAYVLRSPGYILRSENERRSLSGLPAPPCPWPTVAPPEADPPDPEEGAPEAWFFANRNKQRPRLEARGLWHESFDHYETEGH